MTFTRMQASSVYWADYYPFPAYSPDCKVKATWSNSGVNSTQTLSWWPSNVSPKPNPPSGCGWLQPGEGITSGQSVYSCDGRFRLTVTTDAISGGAAKLYQGSTVLWSSSTYLQLPHPADVLIMQGDGNLVRYSPTAVKWAINAGTSPGAHLAIQNDGNLVVYTAGGGVLWSSNTCCH